MRLFFSRKVALRAVVVQMAAVRGTEAEDRRTVTEEIQVGIYKLNMCWTFA